MTTESAHPGEDPRLLLSSARELTQRVRRAQRARWFSLLVFAAVTFAAISVYRYGGHHLGTCVVTGPGLALLLVILGFLAAVLVPMDVGWVLNSPWYFLPQLVIDGSVLLLGGLGFALAQRPSRLPAP